MTSVYTRPSSFQEDNVHKVDGDCCAFKTYWWQASSQYSMRHTHFYARIVCSKLHLQPVPGYQCMERNLIVITFPADFISWVEHDLSEDGVCYLFRCVDYVGAWCRPSSRPRPSSPPSPVPYGHHTPYTCWSSQIIVCLWKVFILASHALVYETLTLTHY